MKRTQGSGRGHRSDVPVERSSRSDDGNAFLPDTVGQHRSLPADDAESFAEEFIASATTGEPVGEDARDEVVDDEEGGPFIVLDDNAQLPPEPDERERDPEMDGHEPVSHEHANAIRRWMATSPCRTNTPTAPVGGRLAEPDSRSLSRRLADGRRRGLR
jgi:hypothetical protein